MEARRINDGWEVNGSEGLIIQPLANDQPPNNRYSVVKAQALSLIYSTEKLMKFLQTSVNFLAKVNFGISNRGLTGQGISTIRDRIDN